MPKARVVSTRMTVADLAKARDGLILKGIKPEELTISQIIKLTFYYGILSICPKPKEDATVESTNIIQERFNQTKPKPLKLNNLEK